MLKTFCLLAFTLAILASSPQSQKRVAKIDSIQIDLSLNQSKAFDRKIVLRQHQAFMVNVEDNETQSSLGSFEVQLQNAEKTKVSCVFNYPNNLCVLQKCTQRVSINVKCLKEKCKAKLSLSHRVLYHMIGEYNRRMLHVPGQIYKVQKQNTRSFIEIYLLKLQDRLLQSDVKIFSNVHVFKLSQVEELDTNNLKFGVKPIITNNDQYFYVQGDQTQKNRDLQFNMITHNDRVIEGIAIFDFIETFGKPSNNTYQYVGDFTKNIQVKVRIFEPKDYEGLPFSITVRGKNAPNQPLTDISRLELAPVLFDGHKFYDIVFVTTKSRHQTFSAIFVQAGILKAADRAIFVQIAVSDVDISDILISDHVYFSSNANQQLKFSVSPQAKFKIIGEDKSIMIQSKDSEKYKLDGRTCSLHKGCQIALKTQQSCQSCSFVFILQKGDVKNSIIYYEVKDEQIQAKIDIQEEFYFNYKMQPYNYSQIIVDSVNVVIFAQFQNYQRCKIPSSVCHQFAISHQYPIIVHNKENITQNLIVNIVGLQKTSFKLRFIQQINGLEVKLGDKFTYLFDSTQKEITVKLSISNETFKKQDEHLYFNLVAPIGALLLKVRNQQGPEMYSNDGYIEFPNKSIRSNYFEITVSKVSQALMKKYVHMTLMVTTADSGVKLDSTATHYQKYLPQTQKKFYMEYEPSQESIINIYTQNLQRSRSKMKLTIRDLNLDKANSKNLPFIQKLLQRDNEVVYLDLQLQNLDICDQINCELEISIKSQSKQELEQTITLIHEESVISLDDSIWNSFQINQLSVTNHFFFIPRDTSKAVTILFSTEDRSLFIDYLIHNTKKNPNPQAWPWERHSSHSNAEVTTHLTGFQQFKLQKEEFNECGDTCVVLITLNQAAREQVQKSQLIRSYKILASTTIIQAPQDLKFHITMKTNQENAMFIEIKNFLKAERLTFFTEYQVGRAKIVATLVSKGVEYSLTIGNIDFVFNQLQTHLKIEEINDALKRHSLKAEQTLLKINVIALSTLKMYFQFTSLIKNLYRMNMDDLEVTTLGAGQEIWYEFMPERDFYIKFYRVSGFPLYKIIKCQEENYIQCLSQQKKAIAVQVKAKIAEKQRTKQDIKDEKAKDIQIINNETEKVSKAVLQTTAKQLEVFIQKNYEYVGQQCKQCIFFIWVYGYVQDIQLSINIRSSNSEIELKEMAMVNDRINAQKQHRKYLINAEPSSATIVSFRIIEGSCHLQITDNQKKLHNSSYQQGQKGDEDITIAGLGLPALDQDQEDNPLAELSDIPSAVVQGRKIQNKHHIFRHLHIKVTSTSSKPIQYLISYSIGYSGVFLQDGTLYEKHMVPSLIHNFYYHNKDKNSHPYLSLSSTVDPGHAAEQSKNEYQAKFYYYPDANNRTVKQEFRPELPPKKNANLLGQMQTHVYQLPAIYELFQIQVYTKNFIKLTASVNHKEVVYLPLGFEYLIKLHAKESIYLVINRPYSDYLGVVIKKCDDSVPNLMYTNDAKEFQKSIYETRQDIFNNFEKKMIKSKKNSKTIHMIITAEQFRQSLFTITVTPEQDPEKHKSQKVKAGKNGLLSYKTLDSNKVEVEFSPIVCQDNCAILGPHYYLLLAQNMSNIYGQLYCAGNYFVNKYRQQSEIQTSVVIALLPQHYYKDTNTYKYVLKLKEQEQFIAVKAMYTENSRMHEVVYLPTEVTTFWRQAKKIPVAMIMVFALLFAVLLTIVVAVSTKLARRGYKPIAESQ